MDGLTHSKQLLNLLCIVYVRTRYVYLASVPTECICRHWRTSLFSMKGYQDNHVAIKPIIGVGLTTQCVIKIGKHIGWK